jgi:hypothetical protein
LNKEIGSSILISCDVDLQLPPHLIEGMNDRGSFQVKGRDQPVRVDALMDP